MKLYSYLESNFNDDKYASYYGGAVAALRALDKNEDIAILTARSNKSAHSVLIKALEDSFSKELNKYIKIPKDRIHFVNDDEFASNLPTNMNSYERKAYVILQYLQNGDWNKIKFYDDDEKNLSTIREWLKKKENALMAGVRENLLLLKKIKNTKLYDIKNFNNKKLVQGNSLKKEGKTLHVFDIDDTILKLPSKIKVIKGNNVIQELLPSELTTYTPKPDEKLSFQSFRDRLEIEEMMKKLLATKSNILKK